ncbi:MAG TPA: NAD-dependent deacylase [Thermoanaerobaculia bacterium]|nr:NAD-dependent deacylase [Thermoanaerobaculia bacterium]
MTRLLEADLRELARRLSPAARVTVVTGAGVSAASGVPTFRGPGGLWKDFRPEDLATPGAFARDPKTVWEWYDWRRQLVARCRPNRAHEVLALWSRRYPSFTLVTQNVDGLHERAGTERVVRFHGSLWEVSCWKECRAGSWPDDTVPFPRLPPPCPHCGGPLRPGVVWFGEAIPSAALEAAERALDCDVCLVVGTSSVVYPAAGLASEAKSRGAFTAEINPEATPATSELDLAIPGRAEEALDRIESILTGC